MIEELHHLVNYQDYWHSSVKPRDFSEFCDRYDTHQPIAGLWEWVQEDVRTGDVRKRVWAPNVITDNGAILILKKSIATGLPSAVFNSILITNNSGCTTLRGSGTIFTNNQANITSIPCAATPAAIPDGTYLMLGYGSSPSMGSYDANGNLPTGVNAIVTNGVTASGATSIKVLPFTTNGAYTAGANIVPLPLLSDNPSNAALTSNNTSNPLAIYSGALTSSGFAYGIGSDGQPYVQVDYLFAAIGNGGTIANSGVSFTDGWITDVTTNANNTNNGGLGNYMSHNIASPMLVDINNNVHIKIMKKINVTSMANMS